MRFGCKISIGFFSILLILSICLTSPQTALPLIISVSIHEFGHLVMARIRHINISIFKLDIFGASLSPTTISYSYKDEIILCIGGPLFNILSAISLLPLHGNTYINTFISYSIALATLNLLPIFGFDGGRIFSALLCLALPIYTAIRISKLVSFVFVFSLWTFSVYLLLRLGVSLPAFVFSISIFSKIFISDEQINV